MYFGDADEQVDYNPLPAHRKGMIGITVVVLVMGLAAPIVMNVTKKCNRVKYK